DLYEVNVRGTIVSFEANDIYSFLRTIVVPNERLREMVTHPPKWEIRHILYGFHSNAKRLYYKDEKTQKAIALTHLTKEFWAREGTSYLGNPYPVLEDIKGQEEEANYCLVLADSDKTKVGNPKLEYELKINMESKLEN
ncbi:hypothetical protein HAX54_009964, partial [Datura stramonium]|nr:hypothetical protein [Datura stramonium]